MNTGHPLVDGIGQIHFQGFILDQRWLRHPLLCATPEKPNISAILVLADLIAWYRPHLIRDPETNQITGVKKKFDGDCLRLFYPTWSQALGLSQGQIQDSVTFLAKAKVVDRTVVNIDGSTKKAVDIKPVPAKVREITFGDDERGNEPYGPMAPHLKTGHPIVDDIGQIRLEGNIIDYRWLGHPLLCNDHGKMNAVALILFADLVYWHTPTHNRNQRTSLLMSVTKKFDNERLYKDYKLWAESFGLQKGQAQDAVAFLVKVGLLEPVITAPIMLRSGDVTNNMPQFTPRLDGIQKLTFGGKKAEKVVPKNREAPLKNDFFGAGGPEKSGGQEPKNRGGSSRKIGGLVHSTFSGTPVQAEKAAHAAVAAVFDANASTSPANDTSSVTTTSSQIFPARAPAAPELSALPQLIRSPEGEWIEDLVPQQWTPERRASVIDRLADLKTVLSRARMRPEPDQGWPANRNWWSHAEFVAHWFSGLNISDPRYWDDKPKGSVAGALVTLLRNSDWLPPQILDKTQKRAKAEAARQKTVQTKQSVRAQLEDPDVEELRKKEAWATFHRIKGLNEELRQEMERRIREQNALLADYVHKKGLEALTADSAESNGWTGYLELAHYALQGLLSERPQLPAVEACAVGEDYGAAAAPVEAAASDGARPESAPGAMAGIGSIMASVVPTGMLPSRQPEPALPAGTTERFSLRLVEELRAGTLEMDEIEDRRGEVFTDAEWAQIIARVKVFAPADGN